MGSENELNIPRRSLDPPELGSGYRTSPASRLTVVLLRSPGMMP